MKKTMSKFLSILLVVVMVLSLSACGKSEETGKQNDNGVSTKNNTSTDKDKGSDKADKEDKEDVLIGLVAMLTGDNPLNGEIMQQCVQMAVDEYNAAGGILGGRKIKLLVEDDQTLQDMAVTAVEKLASEGVVGIIGPHRSTNALAVEATVKKHGVPLFTGGTTPTITTLDNDYLFRNRASDAIFASAAAAYAIEELGAKKIGMLYNSDDYGAGAEKVAREYCVSKGIDFISEGHNTGDTDFTAQITKMSMENLDAVIIWTHDPELAIHARQIYELGLDVNVISSPGITMQQVIDMCEAEYIEGWYGVTDYINTSTDENVQDFDKRFYDKYGKHTELYSAAYYGAAVCLIEAIERAGSTDRDAVMNAIKATKDLQVPVGFMNCDENNDLVHGITVAKIENKTPVYIKYVSVK